MANRDAGDGEGEVIVVASADVAARIARALPECEVQAFRTLAELDAWRARRAADGHGLRWEVIAALAAAGRTVERLSARVRQAVDAIAACTVTPSLTQLERYWPSRRSFYRAWNSELPLTPSAFLRSVRVLHAQRLIANGLSLKEAAAAAGFTSPEQLRRHLARDAVWQEAAVHDTNVTC